MKRTNRVYPSSYINASSDPEIDYKNGYICYKYEDEYRPAYVEARNIFEQGLAMSELRGHRIIYFDVFKQKNFLGHTYLEFELEGVTWAYAKRDHVYPMIFFNTPKREDELTPEYIANNLNTMLEKGELIEEE